MNDEWIDDFCNEEEEGMRGCLCAIGYIIIFWLLLGLCVLCSGCKSVKYINVPEVHTDTIYINKVTRDSIWLHDSIHVVEKQIGDTVYLLHDRWHTKYVESIKHDTIYESHTDSVVVPYPVEVPVEKPLTWWQKTRIHCGDLLLIVAVGMIIIGIIRLKMKI